MNFVSLNVDFNLKYATHEGVNLRMNEEMGVARSTNLIGRGVGASASALLCVIGRQI